MLLDKPVLETIDLTTTEALISPPVKAGDPLKLWSDFSEICDLLKVALSPDTPKENTRFRHISFKNGQTIYKSGQLFDALYLVQI